MYADASLKEGASTKSLKETKKGKADARPTRGLNRKGKKERRIISKEGQANVLLYQKGGGCIVKDHSQGNHKKDYSSKLPQANGKGKAGTFVNGRKGEKKRKEYSCALQGMAKGRES